MEKFKMVVVFLLILMFVAGGYFFIINFETKGKDKESEVEVDFSATGNLIMNNPGLEEGKWYIVYEKEGSPGVTKKLVIGENDIACKGEEGNCSDFFNFKNNIIGERVELKGEERGSEVVVYEVEFLKN
jgi:hypothetical protein